MTEQQKPAGVNEELAAVHGQLVNLADIVESAFAESILALVESDQVAAQEARLDDYKAHGVWLRVDGLCTDLLSTGALSLKELHLVCGAVKIAMDLKLMADEALSIDRHMALWSPGAQGSRASAETIGRIAELTQSTFSDGVEALVAQDASEARGLHGVYGELKALAGQHFDHVTQEIEKRQLPAAAGAASLLVARSLETIATHALDMANHVTRLYEDKRSADAEPAEEE